MDQKLKFWVRPVSVKIKFQNALNGICTSMRTTCGQNISSIWCSLLGILPSNPSKWAQLGPEPKKCSCFFWVQSRTVNTRKLKLGISSNVNEVIRPALNFLFIYIFTRRFHKYKKAQDIKNVYKKHLSSNIKSLRQFSFLTNFV